MVEASKQLVNVFVDCDWGKKNTDLSGKYGVNGYPTVLFLDPSGKQFDSLEDRSPEGVLAQINAAAKRAGGGAFDSWDKAVVEAKKANKPVLYLFLGTGKDSDAMEEALYDDSLEQARAAFVIVKSKNKRDNPDAKKFGVVGLEQPLLLVLDANAVNPESSPLKKIVGKKSAKELLKEFQTIKKPAAPER